MVDQILAFVASVAVGVVFIGAGFVNSWSVKVSSSLMNVWSNILIGIPLLALGVWLPFAFGWIPV